MTDIILPLEVLEMQAPAFTEYHPYLTTGYQPTLCLGRRIDDDTADRRWKPFVYGAYQCSNAPVSGTTLCETCNRHKSLYESSHDANTSNWNGTVDEPIESLPHDSRVYGSAWATAKAKWVGVPKPKTAKQEGRLKAAPHVPQKELDRFARGECELDLESLAAKNQIDRVGLRSILSQLTGAHVSEYLTKSELIARIRRHTSPVSSSNAAAAAPSAPPAPTPEEQIAALTAQVADLTALLADREALLAMRDAQLARIRAAMAP
jgi:hypothetical protein